jgi:hypothetical protein
MISSTKLIKEESITNTMPNINSSGNTLVNAFSAFSQVNSTGPSHKNKSSLKHKVPKFNKNDDLKQKRGYSLLKFKDGQSLNNFLIRDFNIGENYNKIAKSKQKFDLTTDLYDAIQSKKKEKLRQIRQEFEIEKYGGVINESNSFEITEEENTNEYLNIPEHERNLIALNNMKETYKVREFFIFRKK